MFRSKPKDDPPSFSNRRITPSPTSPPIQVTSHVTPTTIRVSGEVRRKVTTEVQGKWNATEFAASYSEESSTPQDIDEFQNRVARRTAEQYTRVAQAYADEQRDVVARRQQEQDAKQIPPTPQA